MNELELRLQALRRRDRLTRDAGVRARDSTAGRPAAAGCARSRSASRFCSQSLAGVLALSPGARSAFLEIFHIRGATVERVETLPDVRAQRLDFGERVSREEAERRVRLRAARPRRASRTRSSSGRTASHRSSTAIPLSPRLVLSQARGAIFDGFIKKTAAATRSSTR